MAVFLLDQEGGSRMLPPSMQLRKEGSVPLCPHLRKNACRACIVDGVGHSILQHREGPGGSGKTNLGCKIRRIGGIGRSWTEMLNLAGGRPGDVESCTGVLGPRSEEECVVDCARFGQVEARCPIAHEQHIVRNRNDPEQT
jgi:hypothetical protein